MARQPTGGRPDRTLTLDAVTALPLDDALHFMRVLWELVHALQTSSKRMQRDLGVTGPQRLAIRVIGLSPGISAGSLAHVLHVDPGTITGVLKRLEQLRLVRRAADPADGRRAILYLTRSGGRINGAMRGTVEAAVRAVVAECGTSDRRAAIRVLTRVIGRLEATPARRRSGLAGAVRWRDV